MENKEEIFQFMQRYSFATLVTSENGKPEATHLPFIVKIENEKVVIKSHFAKANLQWKDLESKEVLIIFTEPHAYISPKNYEKKINVPTWNYISVHVYGKCKLKTEYKSAIQILEETIDYYEKAYQAQWESLPDEYKQRMVKGIVAFEIEVTEIQSKKKLSQNKLKSEQENIIKDLSKSNLSVENEIADYMKKEL